SPLRDLGFRRTRLPGQRPRRFAKLFFPSSLDLGFRDVATILDLDPGLAFVLARTSDRPALAVREPSRYRRQTTVKKRRYIAARHLVIGNRIRSVLATIF